MDQRPHIDSRESAPRWGLVADYVIDLLADVLGEKVEREKRYGWALGDISKRTGRQAKLSFDAVWEARRLIVEVDEDQHRLPVASWDKPGTSP